MTSSKGEPTDPELREKIKEEVKAEEKGTFTPQTSKESAESISDSLSWNTGGGKGKWSVWKASEMARRYEAQGGGYKDTPGSKNKPKKGPPEKKGEDEK